jgi:phospholipase/carboxylesterase
MQLPIEWLPADGEPQQLVLMLHGVGASGAQMAALGQVLRAQFPQAAFLAPDAPHPFDGGPGGRQWFSVQGIDEGNREARLRDALPPLWDWIRLQQMRLGVSAAATCLAGFSQGGILALETAARQDGLAGRVLAFGARFGTLPAAAPQLTTIHLFHGAADAVIPAAQARAAMQRLGALQGDATCDIAEGVGHEMHPALLRCAIHRLTHHIPARTWREALGAAPREAADLDD